MTGNATTPSTRAEPRSADADAEQSRRFRTGLARAFGGAIFFSMPLLMTMEMWWLGFYMNRLRLALLMVLMVPLLIALDHYVGFKKTTSWGEDVVDGMVAYAVGIAASLAVLLLLNVLNLDMPLREWVGKVALQAVPAGFGAVLAGSQLSGGGEGAEEQEEEERKQSAGYRGELLFMVSGSLFLAFNLAPTEEMVLIAFKMTPWHAVALAAVSLVMMHAFVYAVDFKGTHEPGEGMPVWSIFLRFTVVGYAIALLVSLYVLWTLGRLESTAFATALMQTVVLGFPASLGAAAARLII